MYPVPKTAPDHNLTYRPGDKITIKNKRNEPEVKGEVLIHDRDRMLVLVDAFVPERGGSSRWWVPEYQLRLESAANEPTEPSRA